MFDDLERMDGIRLASTVLGLGGMVVASHVSLNTWIAVKSLTPPNPETKEVTADAPLATPVRGWRRIANKKLAAALVASLSPFCIQMFLIFVLPKISSQGVMDAFWVTIEWIVISTMFDQMIICSPFISSSVQLINSKDNKSYLPKATRPNNRFHKIRPFVSGGLSAAILFSASQGVKALYPLATLAFVMAMVFIPLPRISTKMTLLVLNGYFIGMPIVAGTIGYTVDLLVKHFSKSGDTDKPSTDTVPSEWVADAMLMFGSALPYVVGGFMASLALRYDHSKSSLPSALTLPAAPGEAVQIVNKRHSFRAPTFITALIALIGCMGTTIHFINQNAGMRSQFASEGLGLFLVVPVVSIAMLGCVGVRGNLREFWQYEEVWIPKKEEVTQTSTATDVEAAGRASLEGEDEKDALLSKAN